MGEKIRWGILGTGNIARKFAAGLKMLPDAALVAVGSRRRETAEAFGARCGAAHRHASYAALAADPDVDVMYVATPHPLHCENTLLCLDAGKAVLCEKPFALNAAQAQVMIDRARARELFLMDAVWTRFLPVMGKVRELLAAGALGEVRLLDADFGFRAEFDPASRLFDPALGGGGLLDVGIYPVQLASMVFGGPPTQIAALARLAATGVDEQAALLFGYTGGRMAQLSCATRTTTHHEASIYGTEARLRLPAPWWRGDRIALYRSPSPRPDKVFRCRMKGNGYNYEAAAVMACLRAGQRESAIMPLDETLQLMQTLDAIRAQWGMKYPME